MNDFCYTFSSEVNVVLLIIYEVLIKDVVSLKSVPMQGEISYWNNCVKFKFGECVHSLKSRSVAKVDAKWLPLETIFISFFLYFSSVDA